MNIAINIDGQFLRRTGIQHYVDSLLGSLYQLDSDHNIVAFSPALWTKALWESAVSDEFFEWRKHPRSRVDAIGSDIQLSLHPYFSSSAPMSRLGNIIDGRIINPAKTKSLAMRLKFGVRPYHLLHIPDAACPELLKFPAKNNVVTIHDITTVTCPHVHDAEGRRLWGDYFKFAQQHCSRVMTVSEFSKADIVEYLHIPEDRIDVTPLAARSSTHRMEDKEIIGPVLEKFRLQDHPFILYAGTLEPRKNLKRLVEAFHQVKKETNDPQLLLVLAGGHWDHYDLELQSLAEGLGISDSLIMTGYVSNHEMNALMSSCTVFAYVSEYEGFGLPPLEAMVCGAPVVTSNATSLPEVVGNAGILVDPKDTEGIADALYLLLTDSHENQRRRTLSLARAKLFSWENTARLTLKSYEAAVA